MKKREITEWQYQWITEDGEKIWIPEDDEVSASYKAKNSTGLIRSRTVVVKKSGWSKKQQDRV